MLIAFLRLMKKAELWTSASEAGVLYIVPDFATFLIGTISILQLLVIKTISLELQFSTIVAMGSIYIYK
tara:strand:+ start:322 stop:528 length:207 start_codon:yes stop_codon:yes gene_type:complete